MREVTVTEPNEAYACPTKINRAYETQEEVILQETRASEAQVCEAVMVTEPNEAYACPTKINRAYETQEEVQTLQSNMKLQHNEAYQLITTNNPCYEEIQTTVHAQ